MRINLAAVHYLVISAEITNYINTMRPLSGRNSCRDFIMGDLVALVGSVVLKGRPSNKPYAQQKTALA